MGDDLTVGELRGDRERAEDGLQDGRLRGDAGADQAQAFELARKPRGAVWVEQRQARPILRGSTRD